MANGFVIVCPICLRIKKYGKFKKLDDDERRKILMSRKPITVLNQACPECKWAYKTKGGIDEKTKA
jgi:hypothetical protein